MLFKLQAPDHISPLASSAPCYLSGMKKKISSFGLLFMQPPMFDRCHGSLKIYAPGNANWITTSFTRIDLDFHQWEKWHGLLPKYHSSQLTARNSVLGCVCPGQHCNSLQSCELKDDFPQNVLRHGLQPSSKAGEHSTGNVSRIAES